MEYTVLFIAGIFTVVYILCRTFDHFLRRKEDRDMLLDEDFLIRRRAPMDKELSIETITAINKAFYDQFISGKRKGS